MSKYRTIVADPPWPYAGRMAGTLHGSRQTTRTTMRAANLPYSTMSVGDIAALPVPVLAKTHSAKPEAFLDIVEQVSPGPYLEMFARRARFGWSYWGDESLGTAELPKEAA